MISLHELNENILRVQNRIVEAALKCGKNPKDITLVAATKMNDVEHIRTAIQSGIHVCGENRVQELLPKYEENAYSGANIQFIGTLQTNKIKYLLGKVSLIQSVASVETAAAIAKLAKSRGIVQEILLEVNIGREPSKSGLMPESLLSAIEQISSLDAISVQGLMAIPPISTFPGSNYGYFDEMHELFVDILTKKYDNICMNHLSMGMSNDFTDAIVHGSNMVRIGSAIFGDRIYG